ncbi:hypothetical protein QJS04_geneDACA011467 [Acorus gramineus]|uniref:Yippee domain-containing protein n=1 Tax=Acorus gramineus TaxID=55184 RepID=A0AAV9AN48_ACOGR|nr:hypothetical protein QJS04_geneDACA011467 [Acorus gramineus]
MGKLFVVYLEGRIYSCKHCQTHLALYDDIVSKVLIFYLFLCLRLFIICLFSSLICLGLQGLLVNGFL